MGILIALKEQRPDSKIQEVIVLFIIQYVISGFVIVKTHFMHAIHDLVHFLKPQVISELAIQPFLLYLKRFFADLKHFQQLER